MVPAKVRVDCGYPSVTKEECNNRGCCFDSSIRNVPWCFKPLKEAGKVNQRCPGQPCPSM
ncbi:Trefoil factor 3 [Lemmus lemmus]